MVFEWSTYNIVYEWDRTFVHNIVSGPLKDHPISKVSILSIVSKDRTFVHNIVSGPLKDHPISKVSVLSIVSKDSTYNIVYECPVLRNN
jgi:hypothetical protein